MIEFEGASLTAEQVPAATGWHIILAPIKIEEKTKGGIIITHDDQKMAETTRFVAKVLAMGPLCYHHEKFRTHPNQATPHPWCKVGDVITTSSYAGSNIPMRDACGAYKLKVINDDEVLSVLNVCDSLDI